MATSPFPPPAREYVLQVADAIPGLEALYALGSAATGDFDPERSDIDLVAVVSEPLSDGAKRELLAVLTTLQVPVRTLDLVLYAVGSQPPDFDLNVKADGSGAAESSENEPHWFVIDAALAQERAEALVGPAWLELFDPVSPDELREAMREALAWSEARPWNSFARTNAIRTRHYLETGQWLAKKEAEAR